MDPELRATFDVWREIQDSCDETQTDRPQHGQRLVIRWGSFVGNPRLASKVRHQDGHEHQCSIGYITSDYLIRLRPYVRLDEPLVKECVEKHDISEGLKGSEIIDPLKCDEDDRHEYMLFKKLNRHLPRATRRMLCRAFLLQFALKIPACFPREARRIMEELARTRRNEALLFQGIQRWDYLFYAFESLIERGVPDVMTEVGPRQIPHLDKIAEKLPGFSKVIWTPERRELVVKLANRFGMNGVIAGNGNHNGAHNGNGH